MLKSALILVFPVFALSPEPPTSPTAAAQGEALFQSSVRVYGRKSLTDQGFDLRLDEMASSDLLSESPEVSREGTQKPQKTLGTVQLEAAKPKQVQPAPAREMHSMEMVCGDFAAKTFPLQQETLEGLSLLYADLIWIWGLILHGAMSLCTSLREFRADLLAWLTAPVSFGLIRALLLPMLSPGKKIVEDDDEHHKQEVPEKNDIKSFPQRQGMEIKLDVTNPVMIQRAREQIEEAEKRAALMKNAHPSDHRDMFGCTSLHLAAHNCHKEDVAELLKRGFDVNVQDNSGDTPLHMAARSNNLAIVKELLQHRANPASSNAFGKMPFAVANDRSLAQLLREAAMSKF